MSRYLSKSITEDTLAALLYALSPYYCISYFISKLILIFTKHVSTETSVIFS